MNELLEMATRLNGYNEENRYEITKAEKSGDEWILIVKHTVKAISEGAQNESN